MGGVDEGLELGIGSEMRIDRGEIGDPVTVVSSAFLPWAALHRFILEYGCKPDCGHTHRLQIIEFLREPFEVAALVETLVGRIEAVLHPVTFDAAGIVVGITIGKTIWHNEINNIRRIKSLNPIF